MNLILVCIGQLPFTSNLNRRLRNERINILNVKLKQGREVLRRFSQNCEKQLLASSCPSVCMEQLDSHWTDFHEICCLNVFSKVCLENSSCIKI